MNVNLQILFLFSILAVVFCQYPVVKPSLTIIDDGCPFGYMKSKSGACVESSGTLIPVPELDGRCPPQYFEVDGRCHRPPEPHDRCPPGYTNRRGMCRPIVNPCQPGYDYTYGACVPIYG